MSSNSKSPEAVRVAIKNAVVEGGNTLLQIQAHKDHLKEIINHVAEEHELDKAVVRSLINMYHKQNAAEVKNKAEDIVEKYSEIFKEDLE